MGVYRLTIRNGPRVTREKHVDLDTCVAELRRHTHEILGEGRLPSVSAFREYGAEKRVKARLEISSGRMLRRREAGVDVMGDGTVIPFKGGVFRNPIEAEDGDFAAAVAAALRESER